MSLNRIRVLLVAFFYVAALGSLVAQEETVSLPYTTPGQRYFKQLNPNVEGSFTLPHTPMIVGFNANIGQKVLAPGNVDLGVQSNDDLRFLFGFRSDLARILSKLAVGNPAQQAEFAPPLCCRIQWS